MWDAHISQPSLPVACHHPTTIDSNRAIDCCHDCPAREPQKPRAARNISNPQASLSTMSLSKPPIRRVPSPPLILRRSSSRPLALTAKLRQHRARDCEGPGCHARGRRQSRQSRQKGLEKPKLEKAPCDRPWEVDGQACRLDGRRARALGDNRRLGQW